ncbi:inter-alpha-trypsin inhibitor heavy chain H3-like isoform X2 [Platichthys flesus]|uniref:inter-alpha-trypsin inhibitor heavy chain H3-like isoform X2 n=1 Tax=Platichthys flesus TaxID=8260 RepID=UPI002DB729D6|nr:inter-alpha-trypsin inhibitor heavy chain H3-like isoform X2 [Platichthys flesus]
MERAVFNVTSVLLLLALVTTLPSKEDWDIYSFHINSTVTSRYATTVITSRVANRMDESKEIEFHVRIPKNAFISKFRMFIDGQLYDGAVKAKEQAQQEYTQAVSSGQSAGMVSSVGRTLEEFKTSVNVAPHKKVTFELTYEELLKRRIGKYELQIHARPMQPVRDFKVDVYIQEKAGISFIKVQGGLSTKDLANAITKTHADKEAWVHFYPTEDQQKTCDSCGEQGMNGDLVVVYDVNRNASFGDIKQSSDGYFVHHFAPSNLSRISKNVVFIIDQSGSMHGRKIQQTRTALLQILSDLAEDDYFGLITFDREIFHWKRELVQASLENLGSAKEFVKSINDRGATDINLAVLEGARMLNAHPREGSASILILLTDGDPTSGETDLGRIKSNVKEAIAGKFPLYCLGFGYDVNFEFLKTMSLQNDGVARRIYDDSDADIQLRGFYVEVATPLLTDVTMIYLGGTNLTQTNFSQYYDGSEIVVAGQITDNNVETFIPQVVAISRNSKVTFSETNMTEIVPDDHIQRVWAYLTVKQLLEKELQLSGPEKVKVKEEALELSLKYSFVTPLTSMVVTKPQGERTDVLHKPKEGGTDRDEQSSGRVSAGSFGGGGYGRGGSHRTSGITMGQRPMHYRPRRPGAAQPHYPMHPGAGHPRPTMVSVEGLQRLYDALVVQSVPVAAHPPTALHPGADWAFDLSIDHFPPTIVTATATPTTTVAAPLSHRFLLKAENQSIPLCFDVTGNVRLKLLHSPSRELFVNGELDSVADGGFTKIVIRVKPDLYIDIDVNEIIVRDGQTLTHYTGEEQITAGSVTVIKRNKEVDVATGDIRIVILLHERHGEKFLWPVLRRRPSDNNAEGILAVKPAVYEELQTSPFRLQINGQEVDVGRSDAVDYSIARAPKRGCWLVSAVAALQRPLDDFKVEQL